MSNDEDFVDLVIRLGPPPQVIWVRIGNVSNSALQARLVNAMPLALEHLRRGEAVIELGGML
jgi:predicted nuclease of predicted toxin-antitoxin system